VTRTRRSEGTRLDQRPHKYILCKDTHTHIQAGTQSHTQGHSHTHSHTETADDGHTKVDLDFELSKPAN